MVRTAMDLRAPDDMARLLEYMDDLDHSPTYSREEMMNCLDLNPTEIGDSSYFNDFLRIMDNQFEIVPGESSSSDSYTLPSRYKPLEAGHQI
jgi:hypothetical protein